MIDPLTVLSQVIALWRAKYVVLAPAYRTTYSEWDLTQSASEPKNRECYPTQSDNTRRERIRNKKSVSYSMKTVASAFPGERDYVFNRGTQRIDPPRSTCTEPCELSDLFSTIVVRAGAHLTPPTELWTYHNIAYLNKNTGRKVPLFQQRARTSRKLEFLGCYRIVRWTLCEAQGDDVLAFAEQLQALHPDGTVGEWAEMTARDWAKVQLEKVVDPILSGRLHHRYIVRYAWRIACMDRFSACSRDKTDVHLVDT